jgi:hypothetical protein
MLTLSNQVSPPIKGYKIQNPYIPKSNPVGGSCNGLLTSHSRLVVCFMSTVFCTLVLTGLWSQLQTAQTAQTESIKEHLDSDNAQCFKTLNEQESLDKPSCLDLYVRHIE